MEIVVCGIKGRMRLIDAEDFKKRLYEIAMNGGDLTCEEFYKIASALDNQPTAYDTDKVAFRLECESINCHIMTYRAVEIIKSGGIE